MSVSSRNSSLVSRQISGNDEVPVERGSSGPLNSAFVNKFRSFTSRRSKQEGPPQRCMLPDAADMKQAIRDKMTKEPYDVAQYYKKKGFARWIATHQRFEQATLLVILLNAIWIFVDTDYNPGEMLLESPGMFQIAEHLFCVYFSFEWSMRFTAFQSKCDCRKDAWFVFDSMLVSTMVFETWCMTAFIIFIAGGNGGGGMGNASILRMARLLRLSRMARMARLLRAMPELLILVKGMVAAMRSVGFTLGLLFVILYVFGIAFVQLCAGTECQDLFPDVPTTMHSLLLNATLMDSLSLLIAPLQRQSYLLLFVLYLFILVAALTVMNMLIGVICEVVSAVAATERESLSLGYVRDKMQELYEKSGADEDGDQRISKQEFQALLENDMAASLLRDVGVDVAGLQVDFLDTIFAKEDHEEDEENAEEKTLSFGEFMNVVLDLRGGNAATVRDIMQLRKYMNSRFESLEKRFGHHGQQGSRSTRQAGSYESYPTQSTSSWAQQMNSEVERATTPGAQMERAGSPGPISRTFTHGAFYEGSRSNTVHTPAGDFHPPSRATSPARVFSPSSRGFQDLMHDTQHALLRAHELEVASLRRENQQLREQLEQHPRYDHANSHKKHSTPNGNNSPNTHHDMDDISAYLVGSGQSLKAQSLRLNGINGDKVSPREVMTVGVNPDGDFDDPVCGEPPRGLAKAMRGATSLAMRAFTPSFSLGGGDTTSTSEETVQNARCQEADLRKMQERFEKRRTQASTNRSVCTA